MAGQDTRGERALQRCETENALRIAAENELVHPIAKSADAVVEDDRVGHGLWVIDDSSILRN